MRTALSGAVKRHFAIALVLTFCIGPLQCATLERLSLDDMISKSTLIVRGRVTGSYAAWSGPVIYTHYTINVTEKLKGQAGATQEVVVPGGVVGGLRQSWAGAPSFATGVEYVFFLWTSRAGLTQVLGLTQGLFSVASDGSSDPTATRASSNELMFDGRTGRPVKDDTLVMHMSDLRTRIAGAAATSTTNTAK